MHSVRLKFDPLPHNLWVVGSNPVGSTILSPASQAAHVFVSLSPRK